MLVSIDKIRIVVLLSLLLITGCNKKEEVKKEVKYADEIVDTYKDDNPILLGIYENDYKLVTDYYTKRVEGKDLFFTTYFTNDSTLTGGSRKYKWYDYYNKYDNISNYKIGYNISFYAGDKLISNNITSITDEYVFNPYFYIYLYDDIHQADGAWYSHITKSQDNKNTMYTSIKLYLVKPDRVTSPITLTAFTYDSEDDFDSEGNYRGNSKYQIKINWQ